MSADFKGIVDLLRMDSICMRYGYSGIGASRNSAYYAKCKHYLNESDQETQNAFFLFYFYLFAAGFLFCLLLSLRSGLRLLSRFSCLLGCFSCLLGFFCFSCLSCLFRFFLCRSTVVCNGFFLLQIFTCRLCLYGGSLFYSF